MNAVNMAPASDARVSNWRFAVPSGPASPVVIGPDCVRLRDVLAGPPPAALVAPDLAACADGPSRSMHSRAVLGALCTHIAPDGWLCVGFARHVPRVLLLERIAGRTVVVTSALPGESMRVRYHTPGHLRRPSRVADDLAAAADWLAAFQQDTGQGAMDCVQAFNTFTVPAFDRYRVAIGWGVRQESLLARCADAADRLAGTQVPLCAVHGDFSPGNILVVNAAGRRPVVRGVVDWEQGRSRGLAVTDLFKWVASYGSFLDRALTPGRSGPRGHRGWHDVRSNLADPDPWPNVVGFLYAFTGKGWFPALVRAYLTAGYRRLGVPTAIEDVFLPAFVAGQATTRTNPLYRKGYGDLLLALATRTTAEPAHASAVPRS